MDQPEAGVVYIEGCSRCLLKRGAAYVWIRREFLNVEVLSCDAGALPQQGS